MGKICQLVRCPSCHYEFPDETKKMSWLKRLFHRRMSASPATAEASPLTEFEEGMDCILVCLHCKQASRRSSLEVFGLVPGTLLSIRQTSPAYIIRVGETELAIEPDIAREIMVKRTP
jgi:Fe2+ transport system protein FeoA